jgi:ATP-binding cassette, subfamily F, member 3
MLSTYRVCSSLVVVVVLLLLLLLRFSTALLLVSLSSLLSPLPLQPSNHLDLETVEALVRALEVFSGGVLLVSHDERLISNSCSELWVCDSGKVVPFKGDYGAYKKRVVQSFE